jgi:hypothetical protein
LNPQWLVQQVDGSLKTQDLHLKRKQGIRHIHLSLLLARSCDTTDWGRLYFHFFPLGFLRCLCKTVSTPGSAHTKNTTRVNASLLYR